MANTSRLLLALASLLASASVQARHSSPAPQPKGKTAESSIVAAVAAREAAADEEAETDSNATDGGSTDRPKGFVSEASQGAKNASSGVDDENVTIVDLVAELVAVKSPGGLAAAIQEKFSIEARSLQRVLAASPFGSGACLASAAGLLVLLGLSVQRRRSAAGGGARDRCEYMPIEEELESGAASNPLE